MARNRIPGNSSFLKFVDKGVNKRAGMSKGYIIVRASWSMRRDTKQM